MIINSERLRFRAMGEYIAVYGTQDDPYSSNYDVLTPLEAVNMASSLERLAERMKEEADQLREKVAYMAVSQPGFGKQTQTKT